MIWIRAHWWFPLLWVGNIAGAWLGQRILDEAIDDSSVRDAAVAILVVTAILSPMIYLVVRELRNPTPRSSSPNPQTAQQIGLPAVQNAYAEDRGAAGEADVPQGNGADFGLASIMEVRRITDATGETTVGEAIADPGDRYNLPIGFVKPEQLDYYVDEFSREDSGTISRSREIQNLASIKLGEMALVRRLAVSRLQCEPIRRCVAVLQASGIVHPESSLTKLEDRGLIKADPGGDLMRLTERGRRFVVLSTHALSHFDGLVGAYRQVTPSINNAVRFDGRPLGD